MIVRVGLALYLWQIKMHYSICCHSASLRLPMGCRYLIFISIIHLNAISVERT